MNKKLLLPLVAILFLFGACKDDPPEPTEATFTLSIDAKVNGNELIINDTYTDEAGGRLKFERVKFYLSSIQLLGEGQANVSLSDVEIVDFDESSKFSLTAQIPPGSYKGVEFGVGVDSSLNAGDPSTYETDHPLTTLEGMYWSWATKYIFVKVDGYGDSTQTGSLDGFVYHTGLDSLYHTRSFTNQPFNVEAGQSQAVNLELDMNQVFYGATDTIHFYRSTENFTHTTGAMSLAQRFALNFADAFKQN